MRGLPSSATSGAARRRRDGNAGRKQIHDLPPLLARGALRRLRDRTRPLRWCALHARDDHRDVKPHPCWFRLWGWLRAVLERRWKPPHSRFRVGAVKGNRLAEVVDGFAEPAGSPRRSNWPTCSVVSVARCLASPTRTKEAHHRGRGRNHQTRAPHVEVEADCLVSAVGLIARARSSHTFFVMRGKLKRVVLHPRWVSVPNGVRPHVPNGLPEIGVGSSIGRRLTDRRHGFFPRLHEGFRV